MSWQDEYQAILTQSRTGVLGLRGAPLFAQANLESLFADLLIGLLNQQQQGLLSAERAAILEQQINAMLQQYVVRGGSLIEQSTQTAIRAAARAQQQATASAASANGQSLSIQTAGINEQALLYMALRRGLPRYNYRTLLSRNLGEWQDEVQTLLDQFIGTGTDARTAARHIARIFTINDPNVFKLYNRLAEGTTLRQLKADGVNPDDFAGLKTAIYDARRIVVTETNTAYREAELIAARRSPVVGALQWTLSGRHYGLPSTPDVCTIYAEYDLFGQGKGVFPIDNFPSTPHPFCGCSKNFIVRSPEQWNQQRSTLSQPPALNALSFASRFVGKTPKHLQRQISIANRHLQLAALTANRAQSA